MAKRPTNKQPQTPPTKPTYDYGPTDDQGVPLNPYKRQLWLRHTGKAMYKGQLVTAAEYMQLAKQDRAAAEAEYQRTQQQGLTQAAPQTFSVGGKSWTLDYAPGESFSNMGPENLKKYMEYLEEQRKFNNAQDAARAAAPPPRPRGMSEYQYAVKYGNVPELSPQEEALRGGIAQSNLDAAMKATGTTAPASAANVANASPEFRAAHGLPARPTRDASSSSPLGSGPPIIGPRPLDLSRGGYGWQRPQIGPTDYQLAAIAAHNYRLTPTDQQDLADIARKRGAYRPFVPRAQ